MLDTEEQNPNNSTHARLKAGLAPNWRAQNITPNQTKNYIRDNPNIAFGQPYFEYNGES